MFLGRRSRQAECFDDQGRPGGGDFPGLCPTGADQPRVSPCGPVFEAVGEGGCRRVRGVG